MSLKYVLNSMRRHKLRTLVVMLALVAGVALVGALLALVDTQRQFSLQVIGAQTGGYDLSIRLSDLAAGRFFDTASVDAVIRKSYPQIAATHPRIQGDAEARKSGSVQGAGVSLIALDLDQDNLSRVTTMNGRYPLQPGQLFLDQPAADLLGAQVGDEVSLSYVRPLPRERGRASTEGLSTARAEGVFVVSGVGLISGQTAGATVLMRLDDARQWLGAGDQAERLLVVWQSDTGAGNDAQVAVSRARDAGQKMKDAVQQQLGPDYLVELPKYRQLEQAAQSFIFTQIFITMYGLMSMGIIGLMVNALMMTTVAEQKHDLAVLRVIGAPRARLFETVILEVVILGLVGLVLGILLGRALNDFVITPALLASLTDLPPSVRPEWTLQSVLTPTLITVLVLAVATISPARTAGATKVMVVLNPAAADQPTLEDLAKLRERRANYGLLVAGLVLLAFCAVIVLLFPLLFISGDFNLLAAVYLAAFLMMVIGMSMVFYFVTTPLERVLLAVFGLLSRRSSFFTSRYTLRGKGRNALISLMVVASAVLPTLLATQLALTDANIETDMRFQRGAAAEAFYGAGGGRFSMFSAIRPSGKNLGPNDLADIAAQPGVGAITGVAQDFQTEISDRIQLRTAQASLAGIQGDLNHSLYTEFMQWAEGDASALTRIATDPDAVIIAGGMSEYLDLHVGDTIRIKGAGFDHERLMTIAAVGTRLPGFRGITRNRNDAQFGNTVVLMNVETYRELRHDPVTGPLDTEEALFNRALMSFQPGFDSLAVGKALRDTFSRDRGIEISLTQETVDAIRNQLQQSRIFTVLLATVSMVTAVFGVLAVMYTAVLGRRVEIAMLKALGAPGRSLRAIFIGEAVVTTLAAALAGVIAGTLLGYAFEFVNRFAQESPMLLAFDSQTAAVIVAMVCIAAVFSALLAVRPVLRQKAIVILRER